MTVSVTTKVSDVRSQIIYVPFFLHFKVNDLPQNHGADRLQSPRDSEGYRTLRIFKQDVHIIGINDGDRNSHEDGQRNQDAGSQAALRRADLNLPINPEAITDDARQSVQDFGQITASLLLDEQGRDEEAYVNQGHALGKVEKRIAERQAEILLFEGGAEFSCQRLGTFLGDHFQAGGEGMSGTYGTAQKVEGLGKSFLELVQPPAALYDHHQERKGGDSETDGQRNLRLAK